MGNGIIQDLTMTWKSLNYRDLFRGLAGQLLIKLLTLSLMMSYKLQQEINI